MSVNTVIIPARFCGPPNSGNGGYTCAFVARALDHAAAEVTLRKPIPIAQSMQIRVDDGRALLLLGEELIAEGLHTHVATTHLPRVSFADAESAAAASPAFKNHPFPTCFVCGPQRAAGDGLRIFPGIVREDGGQPLWAATWTPAAEFCDGQGHVRPEFIWASLDCPTGFAAGFPCEGKLVTGRLAVLQDAPVTAAERCVLLSWRTGVEGRKHHAAAALVGEDGKLKAHARATWIKLG